MFKGKLEKIYLQWSHLKYVQFCDNSFLKQYSYCWKNLPEVGEYFKMLYFSKPFLHLIFLRFVW